MIALRYGTVPVVRAVGGLKDTVYDWNYSDKPRAERNGYVFHEPDHTGIESGLRRAIGLWHDYPEQFRELILNGMACDYSSRAPAQDYLNIYEHIRHK
jgi:starch synthase